MSRLPTSELVRIYVGTDGIGVAVCAGGLRPHVVRTAWHTIPSAQWPDMLHTLGDVLHAQTPAARIELRLASPLLRLALMPFDPATTDVAVEQALATAIIARTFGIHPVTQPQRIGLSPARYGKSRCIAALDETHAAALESVVAATHHRLIALMPAATVVFDAARAGFARRAGTLALVEADRMLLIDHDGIAPVALRVRPWAEEPDRLQPMPHGQHIAMVAPGVVLPKNQPWHDAPLKQTPGQLRLADPRILFAVCAT